MTTLPLENLGLDAADLAYLKHCSEEEAQDLLETLTNDAFDDACYVPFKELRNDNGLKRTGPAGVKGPANSKAIYTALQLACEEAPFEPHTQRAPVPALTWIPQKLKALESIVSNFSSKTEFESACMKVAFAAIASLERYRAIVQFLDAKIARRSQLASNP